MARDRQVLNVPFTIVDATVPPRRDTWAKISKYSLAAVAGDFLRPLELAQPGCLHRRNQPNRPPSDKIRRLRATYALKVQQALLKILEGTVINVSARRAQHPEQQFVQVDTRNILFICGGAFDGIEKKILGNSNTQAMGYGRMNANSVD